MVMFVTLKMNAFFILSQPFSTGYEKGDTQWGRDQGWRVIRAEECWHKSLDPLMEEIRNSIGSAPVYLSFDIGNKSF